MCRSGQYGAAGCLGVDWAVLPSGVVGAVGAVRFHHVDALSG
jgi:hypothetical protein